MLYRSTGTAYAHASQTALYAGPTVFEDHGTLFLENETVAQFMDAFAQDTAAPQIITRHLTDLTRFQPAND